MKKNYLKVFGLLGSVMMSASLFAQVNFNTPNQTHLKRTPVLLEGSQNNVSRTQSVTITSSNGYVAGSTTTIFFSINYTSTDFDYGDSLAITFPVGLTPVAAGSSDPLTTATEGQGSEALNGVFGQTITWGDNDNSYGGIEPGTHSFYVVVTAAGSTSGTQSLTFYLSSDEYSGVGPYTSTGTISLNESTGPDLVLDSFSISNRYYACPLAHMEPVAVTSSFTNYGLDVTSAANATYDVVGMGMSSTEPFSIPFAGGTSQTVNFATSITPTTTGGYPIVLSTDLTTDTDPTNNIDTTGFVVTDSTMTHDDGTYVSDFSIGSGAVGILGSVYTSVVADTLTSISFYLADPQSTDSLALVVYDATGGTPSSLIQAIPLTIASGATASMYTIPVNIALSAGQEFFIGIEEGNATDMNLGYTSNGFEANTHYAYYLGSWLPVESAGFFTVFILRPNFGDETNAGTPTDTCTAAFSYNVSNLDVVYTDASAYNGSGTLTYAWDFGDGSTSASQNPTYTYADSGTYNTCLTISDGGSCTDQYCADVTITTPNGIANIADSEITIYPNPTKDVLNIQMEGNFQVEVYNLIGALISNRNYNSFAEVDLSDNPSGVYVVKITDSTGRSTVKQVQKTK